HLDIESREVLVQAINEFPGAVVLVSHDEHLIELIADRLWLVADGTVRPFEGGLEDYRRLILEGGGAGGGGGGEGARGRRGGGRGGWSGAGGRREARRLAAERRRELDPLRQQARLAEETVARLIRERDALDRALGQQQGAKQGNGLSPAEALKRRAELVRQIERAETEWFAAAEAAEREARA